MDVLGFMFELTVAVVTLLVVTGSLYCPMELWMNPMFPNMKFVVSSTVFVARLSAVNNQHAGYVWINKNTCYKYIIVFGLQSVCFLVRIGCQVCLMIIKIHVSSAIVIDNWGVNVIVQKVGILDCPVSRVIGILMYWWQFMSYDTFIFAFSQITF